MSASVRASSRVSVAGEVFLVFLRLGCTSFGGPAAHLGYFQNEFVERRRWISAHMFAELVALAQSLPGPASSQVGYSIGLTRGGLLGGFAAWLGFTAPSALLMLAFAFGHGLFGGARGQALLHGLQLVAVAVVAQAVWSMQKSLAPDALRMLIAVAGAAMVLLVSPVFSTPLAIALGAVAGWALLRKLSGEAPERLERVPVSRRSARVAGVLFVLLLVLTILLRPAAPTLATVAATFFRAGALVFGGGHVVLPLLDHLTVARGWIASADFLSGYGAAQAMPGPLFTFAAFVGAAIAPGHHAAWGGLVAMVSLFAPGLLLMTALLPHWQELSASAMFRSALRGVNASVVGVLLAALYRPIAVTALRSWADAAVAAVAFAALVLGRVAPWIVVVVTAWVAVALRAWV